MLLIFHLDGFQPSVDCLPSLQVFHVYLGAGLFVLYGARILEIAELQDCTSMYYQIQATPHVCDISEEARLVPCPGSIVKISPTYTLSKYKSNNYGQGELTALLKKIQSNFMDTNYVVVGRR